MANLKKRSWTVPASSTRKWIGAQMFFAWIGFVHYVRKLAFWRRRSGIAQFRDNYFSEGCLPVSPELRAIAHEPMRCTTCGLCDSVCPEGLSPMRVLLRGGAPLPCASCSLCEQACPEGIPIIRYVQLASKTYAS